MLAVSRSASVTVAVAWRVRRSAARVRAICVLLEACEEVIELSELSQFNIAFASAV